VCLGLELLASLVEVDLLLAERERLAPTRERDDLHAQYPLVEATRELDVGDSEDDVIEAQDLHAMLPVRPNV
jgi:hypothetical protein